MTETWNNIKLTKTKLKRIKNSKRQKNKELYNDYKMTQKNYKDILTNDDKMKQNNKNVHGLRFM